MKTTYFACAIAAQLCAIGICNAQTLDLKAAPAGVAVDGNGKEWGDKMSYTYDKAKIDYTLSNDKENLYLVVKTKDPIQKSSILGAGISLSIDTKGRKKSSYVVTFPASASDADQSRYMGLNPAQIQTNTAFANKYGKLKIEGFKDISDEQIGTDNAYGIKVATGFDEATGYLVYEEAIPLSLFHAGDLLTKEWGFNIKLNPVQGKEQEVKGVTKVANVARPTDKFKKDDGRDAFSKEAAIGLIDLTPETDFWGKFTLAKTQ